ncbi:TPA: glycerate kinase, partial [Candidatus Poribacteria bacterium]|nr:glycerate kinase [Candidatus Poribacteria bacterium]HEX30983.1 glycerate kinase [Candidatus Poribacteria bacterium]
GVKLLDKDGNDIPFGGGGLLKLDRIDISTLDPRIAESEIVVACDVDNPLTGPRGAARVYSPQKGATPEMVEILDKALERFAEAVKRDLGRDIKDVPGAGAAGGLGAGLMAFLNAKLQLGVDIVIEATGLEEKVKGADLVITGEGGIDSQTVYGKTPIGVAKVAKKFGIPVLAVAGGISDDASVVYEHGIDGLMSIIPRPITLDEAMAQGPKLLSDAAERIARLLVVGSKLPR